MRWSVAKGIGRVTGCLPQELADEVVAQVLELFRPTGDASLGHGLGVMPGILPDWRRMSEQACNACKCAQRVMPPGTGAAWPWPSLHAVACSSQPACRS